MLEDENDKQVRTDIGGTLKNKQMLRYENYKQVRKITGEPLKKKQIFRDEKGKWVRTYSDVVSIGKLSNEREK